MRCNIVANRGIIWRGWWMLRIWSTSNNNNSSAHQISMFMIPGTNQAITTDRIVSPTSVRGTACFLPLLLLLDSCIHTHTDCAHYAHTFYDFQLIAEWPRIEFAELKPKHKSPSVNDRRYALGWTFVWRAVVSEGQATIDLIIIIYHHRTELEREREGKAIGQESIQPTTTTTWRRIPDTDVAALMDMRILRLIYSAHNIKLNKLISSFLLSLLASSWSLACISSNDHHPSSQPPPLGALGVEHIILCYGGDGGQERWRSHACTPSSLLRKFHWNNEKYFCEKSLNACKRIYE